MTAEEFKEFMTSEDGKKVVNETFRSWATEKGYKSEDEIQGLVKKKDELLEKVARLNRGQTTEQQRKVIELLADKGLDDPDKLSSIISGGKDNGNDELERRLKRLEAEKKEYEEKMKREHGLRVNTVKESAINKALMDAGVKPEAFDMAKAYFSGVADIEESDDGKVSVIARDESGLGPSIDKFVSEWAKSERAKDFIRKPMNSGAGASGSNGGDIRTAYTRDDLKDPKIAKEVMQRKKAGELITIEG